MTGLLTAWLAEMVLIAYRGAKNGTTANNPIPHLSLPSEYASTFIIYGALAFIPGEGQKVAGAIGWGLVVATALNLWTPGSSVTKYQTTAPNQQGAAPGGSVVPGGSGWRGVLNDAAGPVGGNILKSLGL
jgi:hypothetical protein